MKNIIEKVLNKLSRYLRIFLQKIYKFDSWHIIPYLYKKYPKTIVKYCNAYFKNKSIVEIGCGLGDIIRRIHSKNKTGLDIDQNVLNAAKLLAVGKFVIFNKFSFLENELTGNYDVIILVNWIHEIDPDLLKEKIENIYYHNLNINGIIIIDTVKKSTYKYNHNINYLTNDIECTLESIYEEVSGNFRVIHIIKK